MFGGIMRDGGRTVKEEDLQNKGGAASGLERDAYNSEVPVKNKFLNKDFLRLFRIPLIIAVFLISLFLVFKFLFFYKTKPAAIKKAAVKNRAIAYKKRFSPSVFNYTSKKSKSSNKFKIKFKKETENLKGKIKFNRGETFHNNSAQTKITKKMVVFIKASYGKNILDAERSGASGARAASAAKAATKYGLKHRGRNKKNSDFGIGGTADPASPVGGSRNTPAVPQGTVLDAYTKYKIFSYNTSVPVIAILSEGYYRGGKAVLKKGDKIFGTVSVKHSLNRLNINFGKIIETSGKSINIGAIAMMPDGSGGVKGSVHRHYAGNILASIAQGVVGAASIFAGGGSGINSSNPYTFQNQVRENVAQNELSSAQNGINNYAASNQNISITLPAGTPIKIIFIKPLYEN
jgi:type IV secretory pathway VirB10-like protein